MTSHSAEPGSEAPARAQGVVIVGMCIAIWWPSFTLGAWGRLFFEQILTVWTAATAALLVIVFRRDGERYRVRRAVALLVPSLWLVLAVIGQDDGGALDVLTDVLGSTVAVLGIPATMWVLARIIWPELGAGLSWARRFLVIAAVLFMAVASYLLGVNQAAFLTCADFTVSGNSEPPGCITEPQGRQGSGNAASTTEPKPSRTGTSVSWNLLHTPR